MLSENLKAKVQNFEAFEQEKEKQIAILKQEIEAHKNQVMAEFEAYISDLNEPVDERFAFWNDASKTLKRGADYDDEEALKHPYQSAFVEFMSLLESMGYDYNHEVDIAYEMKGFTCRNGEYGNGYVEDEEARQVIEFVLHFNIGMTYQHECG